MDNNSHMDDGKIQLEIFYTCYISKNHKGQHNQSNNLTDYNME